MKRFKAFMSTVWAFKITHTTKHDAVGNPVDETRLLSPAGRSRAATLVAPNPSSISHELPNSDAATSEQQPQTRQYHPTSDRSPQQFAVSILCTVTDRAEGSADAADPTSAPLHAALSRAEAAEAALRALKAHLAETEDTLQQHCVEWQELEGFLQSLRKMGEKALRKEFNACSDVNKEAFTDVMDPLRISKQGLATLLAAKNVVLSEGQVDELMQRIDTDGDGEIDWREFRTLVRSSSDLEMTFKAIPFERVLASCFPRGPANDALGPFFRQQHSDVVAAVRKAGFVIVKMTMDIIETQKKAEENKAASGSGAKFGAELTGRSFEAFFEGVTGLTGEPHPDLDRGMSEEHLVQQDSLEFFTTSNYAISTCPAIEYVAVMKGMGISTGPGSKVLQTFMESGGKGSGWVTDVTKKQVTSHGETLEKVLVAGTRCCRQKGGQVPEDLRVLHPIEFFGDFTENGRLKSTQVCESDTPLQNKVKRANLTRQEIVSIIMYTGPCFMLYNSMLRGFGNCGEVPASEDVEYASERFWQLLAMKTVASRMEAAGHRFASTMHVLASGIKKLQIIAEEGQGTWVFRGLAGLDIRPFMASQGFTESAFMSTTGSLDVALDYSGVKQGKAATVLAIELSQMDNGADIFEFSQYPGERETVWNTSAYLEYYHGRDEIRVTQWGVVKILHVKVNSNTKALTVEELEGRRKTVVAGFLDTILNDISRGIDAAVESEEFQKRLPVDCLFSNPALKDLLVRKDKDFLTKDWKTRFMQSIKDESAARAKVYKDKDGSWFASNAHLAQAVSDGLALSTLADAKRTLWLRDTSIGVWEMGGAAEEMMTIDYYYNMQRAYAKLLARQRKELKAAQEAAAGEGSDSAAAQRLKELALEECVSRRWITGAEGLEDKDETTWCTPLLSHAFLGDVEVTERLLQARADPEAVPTQGDDMTALVSAAKEGNAEILLVLLKYKANLEAIDPDGRTALMMASLNGHVEAMRVLIENGALIDAAANDGSTSLMEASQSGQVEAIRVLIEKGANLEAASNDGVTSLIFSSHNGHVEAVRVLIEKGANLEAASNGGITSLMLASQNGHVEAMRVLIDKGANFEAVHTGGRTALMFASQSGHVDSMRVLIEKGANLEAAADGSTSLFLASENGHVEAVRVLIENGANLEAASNNFATSLMEASANGHEQVVRVLIEKGANVEAVDTGGMNALLIAEICGQSAVVAVLKEQYVARGLPLPVYEVMV